MYPRRPPLLSWLPHLLSLSSQEKARDQGYLEEYEGVSDECSSGAVRVVQEARPYLVCVLCVQWLVECRKELQDPSLKEERRAELEESVRTNEGLIQRYTDNVVSYEEAIRAKHLELSGSQEKESESRCCHANRCQGNTMPCCCDLSPS